MLFLEVFIIHNIPKLILLLPHQRIKLLHTPLPMHTTQLTSLPLQFPINLLCLSQPIPLFLLIVAPILYQALQPLESDFIGDVHGLPQVEEVFEHAVVGEA